MQWNVYTNKQLRNISKSRNVNPASRKRASAALSRRKAKGESVFGFRL